MLPFGGLYVAGGIAPKILPAIQEGDRFLRAMKNKGRVGPILDRVPTYIVLNQKIGLLGAALCAAQI